MRASSARSSASLRLASSRKIRAFSRLGSASRDPIQIATVDQRQRLLANGGEFGPVVPQPGELGPQLDKQIRCPGETSGDLGIGGCVAWTRGAGAMAPTRPSSRDADRGRASQPQHAIEHVNGHVHLHGPALIRVAAQPVPDPPLPPPGSGLGPGAMVVT
jgi:hypothetical protein